MFETDKNFTVDILIRQVMVLIAFTLFLFAVIFPKVGMRWVLCPRRDVMGVGNIID